MVIEPNISFVINLARFTVLLTGGGGGIAIGTFARTAKYRHPMLSGLQRDL